MWAKLQNSHPMKPLEAQAAELHHRGPPPDGGELAQVPIAKHRQRFPRDARCNETADVAAHLLRRRRDTWNRLALLALDCSGVADHEHLRMVWDRQIGADQHAPGTVVRRAEP